MSKIPKGQGNDLQVPTDAVTRYLFAFIPQVCPPYRDGSGKLTTSRGLGGRLAEGKTKREIIRCFKRHIAREIFIHLTNPAVVTVGTELRAERNAAKISLTTVSTEFGTYPLRISRLERGIDHDREFAEQYRAWLEQQKAA